MALVKLLPVQTESIDARFSAKSIVIIGINFYRLIVTCSYILLISVNGIASNLYHLVP